MRKILELAIIYSIIALGIFLFTAIVVGGTLSAIDIRLYHQYAFAFLTQGNINNIEYPSGAFLYMLIPYLVTMGNPNLYFIVHMLLMFACFIATLIITYFISIKLFGDKRRALITGLICAASPAAVYFVLFRYDALPTFLTMLSIYFFINNDDTSSYISLGLGTVTKWFSAIALPFYLIYRPSKRGTIWFFIVVAIFTVPFAILSANNFIYAYTMNAGRPEQAESFSYMLDIVMKTTFFGNIANYVIIGAILFLIYHYYRNRNDKSLITLTGYITIAITIFALFNKVASPQYFLWVTPLIAVYFSRNIKTILLFLSLQVITYIQFPYLVDKIYNPSYYFDTGASITLFCVKYTMWIIAIMVLWMELKTYQKHI